MRVARPKWIPETDEQRAAIAKAVDAAQLADGAERVLWDAVQVARDLDVPPAYLATVVGRGRATLYRHTRSPADETTPPTPIEAGDNNGSTCLEIDHG